MLKVFIGYDARQALSYNVLQNSIIARASQPVAITPLVLETLPFKRSGLTPFSWSRFLVPHLCEYQGWALFMDADMLCLGDMAELFSLAKSKYAAMVVKNPERFEWASLILFNCGHPSNKILTPDFVTNAPALHALQWLKPEEIGELPREMNRLVGYGPSNPNSRIIHFTQGLPIYPETEGSEYAAEWKAEHKAMNSIKPWKELMGTSVHAAQTADGRLVAKLHREALR